MYHICLLILVGARSATARLQYGTPFLSALKLFIHIVSSAVSLTLYSTAHKPLNLRLATSDILVIKIILVLVLVSLQINHFYFI